MHYSGNDDVVKCFGYISAYQDSKEIYFVIFWTCIQISIDFQSWK
jgi:hypothetical protein